MSDHTSPQAAPAARPGPWYRDVSRDAWRVLTLSGLGWLFEVYEIFILSLTVPAFIAYFDLTKAQASEEPMRNLYRRWAQFMEAASWDELMPWRHEAAARAAQ